MTPYYSDRQMSWFIILMPIVLFGTIVILDLNSPEDSSPIWVIPLMIMIFSAIASMSVSVDRKSLKIRMTYGLPRRTIPIERIRSCEVYFGGRLSFLQCKIKPTAGHFMMTGRGGIVLMLDKGLPVTISAKDPKKLAKAVEKAMSRQKGS
jgi:hypothetical protein